jgi:hypothetical protein
MKDFCKNYRSDKCDTRNNDYCLRSCHQLEFTDLERYIRAIETVGSTLNHIKYLMESLLEQFMIITAPANTKVKEKEKAQ